MKDTDQIIKDTLDAVCDNDKRLEEIRDLREKMKKIMEKSKQNGRE